MTNYRKILNILVLIIITIFSSVGFSLAQGRLMEVPIPGLNVSTLPALPDYIEALYDFSLMAVGFIIFGTLIYGGIRYMTSAGSPAALADAKEQIYSSLLGFIILFGAWLLLNTINPELVILGQPGRGCARDADCTIPGQACISGVCSNYPSWMFPIVVYQDINFGGASCRIGKTDKKIEDYCGAGWNDTISSVELKDLNYVLVIHQDEDFHGKAELIEYDTQKLDAYMNDLTSSITLIRKSSGSGKATLYDANNFEGSTEYPVAVDFAYDTPNFSEVTVTTEDGTTRAFNNRASSISLDKNTIAILYNLIDYKGWGRVVAKDDSDFNTCDGEDQCQDCAEVIGWPHCDCLARVWGDSCWEDKPSSIQIVHGTVVLVEGYQYSIKAPIQGAANAGQDYQIRLEIRYGAGANAPGVAYLGCPLVIDGTNQCQDDFDDIRFTDSDGTTLLDYWRESYTAGVNAFFWVEVDDDLSTNKEIIIQYGNPTVGTTSNVDNTLVWYDRFEGSLGSYTQGGTMGWLSASDRVYEGSSSAGSNPAINDNQDSWMERSFDSGTAAGLYISFHNSVDSEAGWDYLRFLIDGAEQNRISGNVGWTFRSFTTGSGSHTLRWRYTKDGSVTTGADRGWIDYLMIRRYVSPEPVVGTPY